MWAVLRWLGIAAGTCSVVVLIKQGWDFGIAAPLQAMLAWYDSAMVLVAALIEPGLRYLLTVLRSILAIDLELYPHWKHGMVVFLTVFGGLGRATEDALGMAFFISGALVFGLVTGVAPVEAADSSRGIVILAGGAIVTIFALIFSIMPRESRRASWVSLLLILAGVAAIVVGGSIGFGLRGMLIGGAIAVILVALVFSMMNADTGSEVSIGRLLGVPIGVALFIATNAGLQLAGL